MKQLVLICSVFQAFTVIFFIPNYIHERSSMPPTSACKSNLKNLATALEMYSEDHGRLPLTLEELTPKYLRWLPTCPEADTRTYIDGYLATESEYLLSCFGLNHVEEEITVPHYPRYHSVRGLWERP